MHYVNYQKMERNGRVFRTTLLSVKSEVVKITNEEFIRNMSKEELGDFLCSIAGRCKLCELRELCGKKYPK